MKVVVLVVQVMVAVCRRTGDRDWFCGGKVFSGGERGLRGGSLVMVREIT